MEEGCKMSSVDLSDATNHFPLSVILHVLQFSREIPIQHIKLWMLVCKGEWKMDHLKGPRALTWSKGQPLGVYPSFPSFALTHGIILRAIELRYALSDTFRVLGDDVIISNPIVAWSYRTLLTKMGVPVSDSKTFMNSPSIGEFAGKLVIKKGSKVDIINPQKILEATDDNLLEMVKRRVNTPDKVNTPLDLLSLIIREDNPVGLSSWERAALRRTFFPKKDFVEVVTSASRSTYNRLKYYLMNTVPRSIQESKYDCVVQLPGGRFSSHHIFKREAIMFSDLMGYFNSLLAERPKEDQDETIPLLGRLAKFLNLPSVCLSETEIDIAREIMFHLRVRISPPSSEIKIDGSKKIKFIIRRALRNQIKDFRKSQRVVQAEILEYWLHLMTAS
jgi:hypothetical protein